MWSPRAGARRNDMDTDERVAQNLRRLRKDTSSDALGVSGGQAVRGGVRREPAWPGRSVPRGERKPNAMRVRSRILVLVDSINPCDRPWSSAASTALRCRTMRPASSTNTGMRQRRAHEIYLSRASLPSCPLTENTWRRSSFKRYAR